MPKIVQTVVFTCDTQEERETLLAPFNSLFMAESGPSVIGLSAGDELARSQLMFEALDRYDDHNDLRLAIEALANVVDPTGWSWDDYEKEAA